MKNLQNWETFNESKSNDNEKEKLVKYFSTIWSKDKLLKKTIKSKKLDKYEKYLSYSKKDWEATDLKTLQKLWDDWDKYDKTNESNDEVGGIILNVDGRKTTWFYLRDAIQDGLLDETFGLDDDMVEELYDDVDITTTEELTDILEQDFEKEMSDLLNKLLDGIHVTDNDNLPNNITIFGVSEDGEDVDLSYDNE